MAHVTPQPPCFYLQPPPEFFLKAWWLVPVLRSLQWRMGWEGTGEVGKGDSRERAMSVGSVTSEIAQVKELSFWHRLGRGRVGLFWSL